MCLIARRIGGGHNDANDPFYVVRIDPASNRVLVGPKEALARDIVHVKDCNWLLTASDLPPAGGGAGGGALPIQVKLRSMTRAVDATLYPGQNGTAEIHLAESQYGISPGQAAVVYAGPRVLGGGWISGSENKSQPLAA